ncbi:RNA-binding ATPase activator esf2 [Geranomyces variabilis]|uniref:18S rRNA factor 2 n=1 Tax=Geranomyces variabilis TaxID=109894 RepID=A0AAD5TJL6_9FUNG|nr:RNA-binding ATPase activator esf2 [Geranomyces variabilis]
MVRHNRRKPAAPAASKAAPPEEWVEVEAQEPEPETTEASQFAALLAAERESRRQAVANSFAEIDAVDDSDKGDDEKEEEEEEEEAAHLRRAVKTSDKRFQLDSEDEDEDDAKVEVGGNDTEDEGADGASEETSGVEETAAKSAGGNDEDADQEQPTKRVRGPKPLTAAALAKHEAKVAKTGVVYLSRIPPFMRPVKLRSLLSKYGTLGRIYLAPESAAVAARRKKYRKNKRENYTEGWVEFADKSVARAVASYLNGNTIGGKKRNFYYDDIWNIKYLPRFKWNHLTEQIAYELKVRDQKLKTELSAAKKETKEYVKNVGRAKMVEAITRKAEKRKAVDEADAGGADTGAATSGSGPSTASATQAIRRQFKQRKVVDMDAAGARSQQNRAAPSEKKAAVLSKLFG